MTGPGSQHASTQHSPPTGFARSEVAARYDAQYRRQPFEDSPALYRWIVDLADVEPGERVLDIGCGLGGALGAIAARGGRGIGLDLSSEALRRAKETHASTPIIRGDGTELPFEDDTFRVILNLGNLEHFSDVRAGIREMARVLRADGSAWILLPNLYYSGTLWRVITRGYGPDHHQPIDRFATRNEWRDLLEVEGLRVVRSWPYHKGKWWKRLLPANLAWHFLYHARPAEPRLDREALDPLGRMRRS